MAGPRGPPPPPTLEHEIIHIDGPPLDDHPQSPRPEKNKQRDQMMHQEPFGPGPQFAQHAPIMGGYGSSQVSDIRPVPQLTEAFARHKLTMFEVYTLRKAEPLPDYQEYQEERRNSKSSKRLTKPKPNWQRVIITRDAFDQADVVKKIRALDKNGRSVTTKKKDLMPNQNIQVTKLLDEKNFTEFDKAFAWTLVQLETKVVTNRITGLRETEAMTLYLKRAPHSTLDALEVYHNIERAKMMANHPHPQDKNMGHDGPQGQGKKDKKGSISMPKGVHSVFDKADKGGLFAKGKKGKGPTIEILDHRDFMDGIRSPRPSKSPMRGGGNKKKFHRESDSSDYSLSDSDSDRSYYSDTGTTISSRSGHRRRDSGYNRRDREPIRHHEKGYVMVEGDRRRSSNIAFAPDAPRNGPRAPSYERTSIGVDPVAEAFAAGVVAATKAHVSDRDPMPMSPGLSSPRAITYHRDDRSHGSYDDSLRGLRELRIRDDFNEAYPDPREEYYRDDLRREELIRREEMRMREADERMRRDSVSISPRTRYIPLDHLRRSSVSQLPLDTDRAYSYVRNPFAPDFQRRESMRDRMNYRGYN